MKIGIDARMYEATGIGTYLKNLIKILSEIDKNNQYIIFLKKKDINKLSLPSNFKKIEANYHWYSLKEQLIFPFKIKKAKIDLMHFPHFNVPFLYRQKYIVTIQDLILSLFPPKIFFLKIWLYKFILNNAINNSSFIITTSENTKKDIIRLFNINDKKIESISAGVDKTYKKISDDFLLKKVKEKYNIKRSFLMYIGRWRKHKNVLGIVRSFKLLKEKYKNNHQLVFVGKIDKSYSRLLSLIKKLNLQKDLIIDIGNQL